MIARKKSIKSLINSIHCADSIQFLKQIPSNSIDLILTSPPYFQQREYGGGQTGEESSVENYIDALMDVFHECVRITKDEGNIVFNLGDKYIDANLVLVPYRFAIKATSDEKIKLVNEITWIKSNPTPRQFKRRLVSSTEPFFHFVKTNKYFYNLDLFQEDKKIKKPKKVPKNSRVGNKYKKLIEKSNLTNSQKEHANNELEKIIEETKNGEITSFRMKIKGIHSEAFGGTNGGRKMQMDKFGFTLIRLYGRKLKRDIISSSVETIKWNKHPSIYPQKIILEFVKLLSPPNGIILDPYFGSGTTGICAKKLGRNFIGIDINADYCEMSTQRINNFIKDSN